MDYLFAKTCLTEYFGIVKKLEEFNYRPINFNIKQGRLTSSGSVKD